MKITRAQLFQFQSLEGQRTVSGSTSLREVAKRAVESGTVKVDGQIAPKTQPSSPNAQKSPSWNKYGAKKVVTSEGTFDSQIEYRRWGQLKLLRDAGLIKNLERQIPFVLEVNGLKICKFTIDHRWIDCETGVMRYEDVKGVLVRDFMLRVKLIKAIHGIDVQVWPERKRRTNHQ